MGTKQGTTTGGEVTFDRTTRMLLIASFNSTEWLAKVAGGDVDADPGTPTTKRYDSLAATWLPRYMHFASVDKVTAARHILDYRAEMDGLIAPAVTAWGASCEADHNDPELWQAAQVAVIDAVIAVKGDFSGWDDRYTRSEIGQTHGRTCTKDNCASRLEPQ
jgi:hypothetical protein